MTSVSVQTQTGRRVAVTVSGLELEAPAVDYLTLWRDDLDHDRTGVRGFVDVEAPASGTFVAHDYETPLARPVYFVLEVTREDGTRAEYVAGPVTLASDYPIVSNPVTGEHVELTLETWTDVAREGRGSVVAVHDRVYPVVVSGIMAGPTSAPVMRTDTRQAGRELRSLLAGGQVVHLRVPELEVEDAYFAVTAHTETRVTNRGTDPRRRHTVAVAHVSAPLLEVPAMGDTLDDLAAAFPPPSTLADVAATWGTLVELAAADLGAL
jgi:hypothetical protein